MSTDWVGISPTEGCIARATAVLALVQKMPDGIPLKTIARALQLDPDLVRDSVESLFNAQLVFSTRPYPGKASRIVVNDATLAQWARLYEEADRAFV